MRDVINKNVTEDDLESAARNAFSWHRMKLYFMMGFQRNRQNIQAIPRCKAYLDIGQIGGKRRYGFCFRCRRICA